MLRFVTRCLIAILLATLLAQETRAQGSSVNDDKIDLNAADFWQTLDGKPVAKSWEFADGEARLVNPRGGGGSIVSGTLPANFELSWQWKIEKGTNTGLKYRVRKFGNRYLGIEYQIMDDNPNSHTKGSTASIYDLVPPNNQKHLKLVGQWNQARVVAIGNRLQHFLNGKLVASATTQGPMWDKRIALSKFFGDEGFATPQSGDCIMLTDHGGRAVYRDFQFIAKQAPSAQQPATKLASPYLGNGMRNSWADQNSIVIWTRTTLRPEMLVDGKQFNSISGRDAKELAGETDSEKLLNAQLPKGAKLSEMFGGCPGAVGRVRLMYFPGKQRSSVKSTDWITTNAQSDFTAQWKIEGLKPDTIYAAIVEAQSVDSDQPTAVLRGQFRTAPKPNATKNLRFCITTCHDFIRRDDGLNGHKIYTAMSEMEPDFVVHAGDIEYYDKPDPWAVTIDLMRFKWGRIFSLPNNRDFYNRTTSYFLKDDHDTLKNDCWAGQTYGSVSFQQGVRLFNEEQFPTLKPRYTTIKWGRDLQIWFLEGRDYRSSNAMPDGPDKSILGEVQKEWLFRTLAESKSKFKLICSPTPVVGPDRANKKDNHANEIFAHEGNEIRSRLAKFDNVIVLCGDRHWQYASFDPISNLWEFGCGPGSEKHQLGWKPGDKRPLHQFLRVKGGFLSGQLEYKGDDKDAQLTIRHHKVTGQAVSEFHFPTDQRDNTTLPKEESAGT